MAENPVQLLSGTILSVEIAVFQFRETCSGPTGLPPYFFQHRARLGGGSQAASLLAAKQLTEAAALLSAVGRKCAPGRWTARPDRVDRTQYVQYTEIIERSPVSLLESLRCSRVLKLSELGAPKQ
jgi:hypothetical protein